MDEKLAPNSFGGHNYSTQLLSNHCTIKTGGMHTVGVCIYNIIEKISRIVSINTSVSGHNYTGGTHSFQGFIYLGGKLTDHMAARPRRGESKLQLLHTPPLNTMNYLHEVVDISRG